MAAIVQQQPAARSEESAARQFWREKMDEHPTIAGLLAIAGEVAGFFLNGHFIVALARWIIRVSGYVAESALLFANLGTLDFGGQFRQPINLHIRILVLDCDVAPLDEALCTQRLAKRRQD